jgi:hypothetical protein
MRLIILNILTFTVNEFTPVTDLSPQAVWPKPVVTLRRALSTYHSDDDNGGDEKLHVHVALIE